MVLGKLPVPGRPTSLITVGQGPIARAVAADGGGLDIFTLIYPFSSFSHSSGDGRYRLKYCLIGQLNPKQATNHKNIFCDPSLEPSRRDGSNESHNICFHGKIRNIIIELSSIPSLVWSSGINANSKYAGDKDAQPD